MGEMADYIINGDDCQECGVPFNDEGEGFPRTCDECLRNNGGDKETAIISTTENRN